VFWSFRGKLFMIYDSCSLLNKKTV
jgi:hypothetical protein